MNLENFQIVVDKSFKLYSPKFEPVLDFLNHMIIKSCNQVELRWILQRIECSKSKGELDNSKQFLTN